MTTDLRKLALTDFEAYLKHLEKELHEHPRSAPPEIECDRLDAFCKRAAANTKISKDAFFDYFLQDLWNDRFNAAPDWRPAGSSLDDRYFEVHYYSPSPLPHDCDAGVKPVMKFQWKNAIGQLDDIGGNAIDVRPIRAMYKNGAFDCGTYYEHARALLVTLSASRYPPEGVDWLKALIVPHALGRAWLRSKGFDAEFPTTFATQSQEDKSERQTKKGARKKPGRDLIEAVLAEMKSEGFVGSDGRKLTKNENIAAEAQRRIAAALGMDPTDVIGTPSILKFVSRVRDA